MTRQFNWAVLGGAFALVLLAAGCSSTKNDPCKDVTCSGHGTCADVSGAATCTCATGYTASALECVSVCSGVTCSGHGTCSNTTGAAVCTCETGYVGATGNVCQAGIPLSFSIDDSANATYVAGQLYWKGSFAYDASTQTITRNTAWPGPDVPLYDDGPAPGGHEKAGATAGDHIWTTTVYMAPQATATSLEYGAMNEHGWIWIGSNGTVAIPAGSTAPITVPGLVIPAFGDVDFRVTIDTANLDPAMTYTAGDTVQIKGSFNSWTVVDMTDNGDGTFTFTFGPTVSAAQHTGLLVAGTLVQWCPVIHGAEYKVGGAVSNTGVTVETKQGSDAWKLGHIYSFGNDHNAAIRAGAIGLTFTADDTAAMTYLDGQLKWKGSFKYNTIVGSIVRDTTWPGPSIPLYDDGPWTAGGHEGEDQVAGDHILSTVAWLAYPTADVALEYGAEDEGGWIWSGPNGTYTVTAGTMTDLTVSPNLVIPGFGIYDFRIDLDTALLFSGFAYAAGDTVQIKGSWGWDAALITLTDNLDGTFTYHYADHVGEGTPFPHQGLLNAGDEREFVFVIHGVEYKDAGVPSTAGVTAQWSDDGATTWNPLTVSNRTDSYKNTFIQIPVP